MSVQQKTNFQSVQAKAKQKERVRFSDTSPTQDKRINMSFVVEENQYKLINTLAAFNNLTKSGPVSCSDIVRTALDMYFDTLSPELIAELQKYL